MSPRAMKGVVVAAVVAALFCVLIAYSVITKRRSDEALADFGRPAEAATQQPIAVAVDAAVPIDAPTIDAPPTETELEALRLQAKIRAEEERDRPRREAEEAKAAKKAAAEAAKLEAKEAAQQEIADALNALFKTTGVNAVVGISDDDLMITDWSSTCDRPTLVNLRKALVAMDLDPKKVFTTMQCTGDAMLRLR